MRRFCANSTHGLTLVELMAIVAIIGVLAGLVIPRITADSSSAKKNACYVIKGDIEVQVQRFYRNEGSWPATSLADMAPPGTYEYFPDGLPVCPVDGSSYAIDASTHEVVGHTH